MTEFCLCARKQKIEQFDSQVNYQPLTSGIQNSTNEGIEFILYVTTKISRSWKLNIKMWLKVGKLVAAKIEITT